MPISPILFLIYSSKVFNIVTENNLTVISLSFVDDLRFISSSKFFKQITQTLGIVAITILDWVSKNAVT